MFSKILVLHDGSNVAGNALKLGLELSKNFCAECHTLRIIAQPKKFPGREAFDSEFSLELTFTGNDIAVGPESSNFQTHTFPGDTGEILREHTQRGRFDLVIVTP